ncbi:MAG: hypothetical protein HGA55_07630, partial [Methanoregulaceae archaeon]|nr:hypothetical protein [Methanoregulaceae archaeon]
MRLPALLLLLLLVILPSATAVSIGLSPLSPGVPVNVTVRDLPDGARFTLLTEAVCRAPPGRPLVFELSSFRMPFSLQGGGITTYASNARWVKFEAKLGNVTAGLETSPGTGVFSHQEARNISPGTYPFIRLSALPGEPGDPVTTRIELSGNKTGPRDSLISFVPEGVTSCDLH